MPSHCYCISTAATVYVDTYIHTHIYIYIYVCFFIFVGELSSSHTFSQVDGLYRFHLRVRYIGFGFLYFLNLAVCMCFCRIVDDKNVL